jgi:hypothetical protein
VEGWVGRLQKKAALVACTLTNQRNELTIGL